MATAVKQKKRFFKEDHKTTILYTSAVFCGVLLCGAGTYAALLIASPQLEYTAAAIATTSTSTTATSAAATSSPQLPPLDREAYDKKVWALANNGIPFASSTWAAPYSDSPVASSSKKYIWPVRTAYPNAGATLPFYRVVAYYGNFYSKGMGVLGEYPTDVMLQKLKATVAMWQAADPSTPVMPAIDYIAVTAQASGGADGKYRARMPDSQIDKAIQLADQVGGIVILDVQVGKSTAQIEVPLLENYLKMPNVHLAIDPEFSMKGKAPPGREIGTYNAADINWVANYLAQLVEQNNLPPKILIVHRFTEDMVTGYRQIKPLPEVQIVMDMDGWGFPAKKVNTYNTIIYPEPVQFTGFKLFYKNDLQPPTKRMMTPAEVLKLKPKPIFIQYQ